MKSNTAQKMKFFIKGFFSKRCSVKKVIRRCSVEKVFLKISQNSKEKTAPKCLFKYICRLPACTFATKEIPIHVFSREFYKIFKNTYFAEYLRTAALELLFSREHQKHLKKYRKTMIT